MERMGRPGIATRPATPGAIVAQHRFAQRQAMHVCDECCPFASDALLDDGLPPSTVDQDFEERFFE